MKEKRTPTRNAAQRYRSGVLIRLLHESRFGGGYAISCRLGRRGDAPLGARAAARRAPRPAPGPGRMHFVIPAGTDFCRDGFETSPPWFHVLVAEQDGNILGCALYYRYYSPRPSPPGRALLLRMLCVRKSTRRCGVGTKLFRGLCRVALEENAQLNWTHPASDPAAAFFAQFNPDISDDLDGTYIMRICPKTVREIAARKMRMNKDISILMARKEDMAEFSMMIREISVIRETLYGRHLNEKDFIEDGFTSSPPWFFALIAWRAGVAVGTTVGTKLYSWEQSLDMQSLYVRPEARRCGLAKQLIVEFCRKAEDEGIDHVDFHVHPVNTEALALYASFGAQKLFDDHGSFRLEVDKIEQILSEK